MTARDPGPRAGSLTVNRKALRDYRVLEKIEAGIALLGSEVKVIRNGEAGLTGAFARAAGGEMWLHQVTIPPYTFAHQLNHDALRTRRLLLHRSQIRRLAAAQEQDGLTIVPLRLYLTPKGIVKVELGLCRGKRQEDKRETIRRREADREAERAMARHGRG
jgi:SsrA-binding protein